MFELNDVKGTCYMPGIGVGTLVNLRQLILIPVLCLKKLILSPERRGSKEEAENNSILLLNMVQKKKNQES